MSIQIQEISSETAKKETVESIQHAPKRISNFFNSVNDESPSIGEICRKFKFEEIELKTKK